VEVRILEMNDGRLRVQGGKWKKLELTWVDI
jgi:hypothetical protein